MSKMKKLIGMVLLLTFVMIAATQTLADNMQFKYLSEAQKLNKLGLYKGISTSTFDPDLGSPLNRETGVVMLLRLIGDENQALKMDDSAVNENLARFKDSGDISKWARKHVAYAVANRYVFGATENSFDPKGKLTGKAYCTLLLRAMGYSVEGGSYDVSPATLKQVGGITQEQANTYTNKDLIRDDLVGISFGTLKAVDKKRRRLINILINIKAVDGAVAKDMGLLD